MPTIPEFDTSAEVTGATLISETDEEIRQLMTDVKSYQESVSAILNNYTTEEIDSAIANLNANITLKLNELLSVNPDGTYYTKNAIDSKIDLAISVSSGNYSDYGFTSPIKKEDLFEETATANSIVIKASPSIRGFKKIHERNSDETITLPLAPFDPLSNDNIYATGSTQTSRTYSATDIIIQEDGDVIWQFLLDTPISTTFASLVLGTDYQVLDEVSRQDLFYWAEDKTTGAGQWKSVKGLKHYLAKDILNHDLIASDRGWTKLGNNLYSDGVDEITCITVVPRLNAGMYHPAFNKQGVARPIRGDVVIPTHNANVSLSLWYLPTEPNNTGKAVDLLSAYDCINPLGINIGYWDASLSASVGESSSGHPSKLLYDKIYLDGENGIIYKKSSAKEIHENNLVQEWQRDCVSDLDGINSQNGNAYFTTQGTALVVEDLTDTAKVLWDLSGKAIEVKQVLYTTDGGTTWNTETFTLDSVNNQITLGNTRAEIKVSYVAQNQTLQQQDPIEILAVGNQAIFSNSNDTLQGNSLIQSATGKIATSDSLSRVESKSLENIIFDENNTIVTTPSHNASLLNTDNSTAFKGLPFVGKTSNNELVIGMFTEEGKYNASGYGWNTGVGLIFQQLANGLVDGVYENDLQTKILYKRTGRFKND